MNSTIRWPFLLGFVCCVSLLAYAYYVDWSDPLIDPCPLCIIQRIVFFAMALVFLLGGLHGVRGGMAKAYGLGAGLLGFLGAAIAAWHVRLQNLPLEEQPLDCLPGFGYMAETKGFLDALGEWLPKAFEGTGDCAVVDWTFLGLSMPSWTLIWYLGLAIGALFFGFRARR